jgi:hypothetical protein
MVQSLRVPAKSGTNHNGRSSIFSAAPKIGTDRFKVTLIRKV